MCRNLIADDQPDVAPLWAMMLGELGHEVHVATDGKAALEMARQLRPQLVLVDIGLPEMSGLDVALQLRQEFSRHEMVLIAFTGRESADDRRRSLEAGFDYHFVKPVGIELVEELICRKDLFA
jgi:CheY-like chemotaxis protein